MAGAAARRGCVHRCSCARRRSTWTPPRSRCTGGSRTRSPTTASGSGPVVRTWRPGPRPGYRWRRTCCPGDQDVRPRCADLLARAHRIRRTPRALTRGSGSERSGGRPRLGSDGKEGAAQSRTFPRSDAALTDGRRPTQEDLRRREAGYAPKDAAAGWMQEARRSPVSAIMKFPRSEGGGFIRSSQHRLTTRQSRVTRLGSSRRGSCGVGR